MLDLAHFPLAPWYMGIYEWAGAGMDGLYFQGNISSDSFEIRQVWFSGQSLKDIIVVFLITRPNASDHV